jgi:hypothetical protein
MPSLLNNIFGERYTLSELMNIDGQRQTKAGMCSVSLVNTFLTLKEETLADKFKKFFNKMNIKVAYLTLKLNVTSDTGNTHTVFIQLDPDYDASNLMGNKIRVYCDCPDFKYRSAYLLGKRDSLFSNDHTQIRLGAALTDIPKGKKGVTLLCKHSFAAIQWLFSNYTHVMKSL